MARRRDTNPDPLSLCIALVRGDHAAGGRQVVGVLRRASRDGQAALHCRARAQFVKPAFEVFEFVDVLTMALPVHSPWITDHVGDGVFFAGEIATSVEPLNGVSCKDGPRGNRAVRGQA
jgi:hypothetical protein